MRLLPTILTARIRRELAFTRSGGIFLFLTVGVGLAALNTGNNLIYIVFGALLGLILASGLLSEKNLRQLELDWISPAEIEAGKAAPFRLVVRNRKKRLPSLALGAEVVFSARRGAASVRGDLLLVSAGGQASSDAVVSAPVRGLYVAERVALATLFPFGIFRKTALLRNAATFVVYPALLSHDIFETAAPGSTPRRPLAKGEGDSFWGVREWQTGDNPRRIAWKTSARLGKLVVRETEREVEDEVLLRLDLPAWAALSASDLESALSFTATLADRLLAGGTAVGLGAGQTLIPPAGGGAQRRRILTFLALLEPAEIAAGPSAERRASGAPELDPLELWRSRP